MRIDKLLWFLRFARTRPIAQALCEAGHIRRNGRRVEHAHVAIAAGDVLVIPLSSGVDVIEIVALPARRGPASEARACYRMLDAHRDSPIAGQAPDDADPRAGRDPQP